MNLTSTSQESAIKKGVNPSSLSYKSIGSKDDEEPYLQTHHGTLHKLLPSLGSALVASVAYMDPGNFVTNIQAGSQFGYTLLWVTVWSNCIAILLQYSSAKLGIVTGSNLPEIICQEYPKWSVYCLWLIAEVAVVATDIGVFIGAALGISLVLHCSLIASAFISFGFTFLLLLVHQQGSQVFEGIIFLLMAFIGISYLVETSVQEPHWKIAGYHTFVPTFQGNESILLAAGILGTTVMPHILFLHSALSQTRIAERGPAHLVRIPLRYESMGIIIALGITGIVNFFIVMAAATYHIHGGERIYGMEDAYKSLQPVLGDAAKYFFGFGLFFSGISAAVVGTLAGQVIMTGFIHCKISVWLRRTITTIPSFVLIASQVPITRVLVLSQVVLSFCVPFAVIPLALFTGKERIMDIWKNSLLTTVFLWGSSLIVIVLNLYLLWSSISGDWK